MESELSMISIYQWHLLCVFGIKPLFVFQLEPVFVFQNEPPTVMVHSCRRCASPLHWSRGSADWFRLDRAKVPGDGWVFQLTVIAISIQTWRYGKWIYWVPWITGELCHLRIWANFDRLAQKVMNGDQNDSPQRRESMGLSIGVDLNLRD